MSATGSLFDLDAATSPLAEAAETLALAETLAVPPDTTNTDDDLPEGWTLTTIGDACALNPGKPAVDRLPPDAPISFVPMPAVDAEVGAITERYEKPYHEVRGGYTAFADGDVIFAKITPCMENGKAAVADNLTNGLGFGSSEFHVLRPNGVAEAKYLFHFLRQESFRQKAREEMTGSVGQARVPAEYLREHPLPLPPLAEQQRIVEAIEAALTHVNTAREQLTRVPKILKRFRQSVLAAACSGRLTADWREANPDVEPASVLLDRIREERKVKEGKKYKEPVPVDTSELEELPDTWKWTDLGQITSKITSGSRDWTQFYGRGTGTFLMAQNIRSGVLDLSFRQAVDPPIYNRDKERSQVEYGDLLVTIVGANTGDACMVPYDLPEHYVCQSVALIRPCMTEWSRYLATVLLSPEHGHGFFEKCFYGAGRPHLSFDQLRATPVPLSPLTEQVEIIRRVERLFVLADLLEKRVVAATVRVEKTTQAVLAKAFRGDLVSTEAELARRDGQEYEPARALLERIKRECGAQATTRARRGRSSKKG